MSRFLKSPNVPFNLLWPRAEEKVRRRLRIFLIFHNSLKSKSEGCVSTQSRVIAEPLCSSSSSCFFIMSFLGITLILAIKKLIWSTAAVFHNVVEALAQKCDGDQCSLYLLGWRLTLINVRRRCINLRTNGALFGGLYFKLCHLLCRRIVLLTVGPSLFLLCDVSGALLYIITYHKWAHGKWQGRHLQRGRHHFINVSSADFY